MHPGPRWSNVEEFYGIGWHASPVGLGGGVLRIFFAYSSNSESKVGLSLVSSFLTVISLRDHLYFDGLLGRAL